MEPIASEISQPNGHQDHQQIHPQPKLEHQNHQRIHPQPKLEPQFAISTLPQVDGWVSSDDVHLYQYQGFWYWAPILTGLLASQDPSKFNPSPSNIIICSNPKSGTTWLKALAFAITTRTQFDLYSEDHPLHTTVPHALNPTIEKRMSQNIQPTLNNSHNLLSTHMPYTSLPESLIDQRCKIVYICRDPKDAFVSLWHFAQKMRLNKDVTDPIPLEEAFNLFCKGASPYGPYWDHVIGYWKANLDQPHNVLFLKYEDLMQDVVPYVKRLAEFVGCPFSDEEEKKGIVMKIVEMCSFESLSNLDVNKNGCTPSMLGFTTLNNDRYFRKGKVGDWRNYLSDEMSDRMDRITVEKLNSLGLQL